MKLTIAIIVALMCFAVADDQVGKVCKSTSFYWNGTACASCPAGCSECVWKNNAVSCINCGVNSGKYQNIVGDIGVCANCSSNCLACRGPGVTDCTKAADGYSIASSGIVKCTSSGCLYCTAENTCGKCQFGYRLANGTCTPCSSKDCADCTDAISVCKKCNYMNQLNSGSCTKCEGCKGCPCTSCHEGFRFNNGTCTKCSDPHCTDCAANLTICTACKPNFYANVTCQKCTDACKTCSGATTCTSCMPGLTLNGGNCTQCPGHCAQCDSAGLCTTCDNNFYPSADKKTCNNCPSGCDGCDKDGKCIKCLPGSVLKADRAGCDTCATGCSVCANASTCTTCLPGFNPDGKGGCKALASCQKGQQLDGNGTCTNGNIDNCVYGNNITGSCFLCASAYYVNGKVCSPCPNGCEQCIANANGYVNCTLLAQLGFSAINSNGKADTTGYLGLGGIATVIRNNTAETCMPNYFLASPLQNPANKQCVAYEQCTYPYKAGSDWSCVIEGNNAAKVTLGLFGLTLSIIFIL